MSNRWSELLSPITFRNWSPLAEFDGRNPFENDYGRLISSSSIRRLQDKTQVFPLEQSDFIRTRLTHSLEVSYIASSIGLSVEKYLLDNKLLDADLKGHICSLLRVAGLVHDLGNPPFGHFGEVAIQSFFQNYKNPKYLGLGKQEKADFECFDGNVQTFRVLRKLHFFGDEYSFNLSFPALSSIIKYPSNSIEGNLKKNSNEIRKKKFGYFISEQKQYEIISEKLKLNNKRHPIVYLLEAADDIAFCAADIEDGVKLGILDYKIIYESFEQNLSENSDLLKELETIHDKCKKQKLTKIDLVIQKFRIETQKRMIGEVLKSFEANYELIMKGELEEEILYVSKASDIRNSYRKLQAIVFNNKRIMETELAGSEAISGLLKIFLDGILSEDFDPNDNNKESRLYKSISSSYRYIYENYSNKYCSDDVYNRIQLVLDFIVGMTDSYTVSLFQKLKGIRI